MKIIHAQLYDGGWLVKVEHNGFVFTGTGWTLESAESSAKRLAMEAIKK